MRRALILTFLLAHQALAQYPSAAGIPFSPTMPYPVPNVNQAPANGGFSNNYYYGYGQYGYGYPAYGYGYGYGPSSYYNQGSGPRIDATGYPMSNYSQTYKGYDGKVGGQFSNGQGNYNTDPNGTRSFPSASSESSLHRGW